MSPTATKPDLRCIGEKAFSEVLGTLLSLRATLKKPAKDRLPSDPSDQITTSVLLTGERVSGSVQLRLPRAFVRHVVRLLSGLDGEAADASARQEDAAGELANMVAGRVAAQLQADGYPCRLGTPSVFRSGGLPVEIQPGAHHERTDLVCEGHWLSLELQCRCTVP